MKKIIYLVCCAVFTAFVLAGCGKKDAPASTDTSALAGTWNGCGNAVGKDSSFRAENLSLQIGRDGSFTLSDIEQGTDLFHGTFSVDSNRNISIFNGEDSANKLPKGWESFTPKKQISGEMADEKHLFLTYNSVSYCFEKEDSFTADGATSVSPLLDIAETDIWYSSSGGLNTDSAYELALYDKYAELYLIKPDTGGEGVFLTNFLYLSNDGDTFSFYTYKEKDMELPDLFETLPEGLNRVDITLSSSNESLIMEYNGNSLSFYNNVIYGLETSSAAYFLKDTCFYWRFDQTDHFCYFSTDETDGSLYLYISDGKQGDAGANTIRGKITVDKAEKNIIFDLDKKSSKKTSDKTSALFQQFKKLDDSTENGLSIPFQLKDSKLKLKTKNIFGKNYSFDLSSYQNE